MRPLSKLIIVLSLVMSIALATTLGLTQSGILLDNIIVYEHADTRVDAYTTIFIPKGKEFKILQLTDTQLKYPVNNYEIVGGSNEKTFLLVQRLIRAANPDLVIFTGNLVMSQTLNNWPFVQVFAEILEQLSVYWTISFGNHDSEASYIFQKTTEDSIYGQETKEEIINRLKQYPHCLISKGDAGVGGGVGNHFINLREKRTEELIYSLCVMDCVYEPLIDNTYHREKTDAQVNWYKRHINSLSDLEYGENRSQEDTIASLLFANIPVPEFFTAYDVALAGSSEETVLHYGRVIEGSPNEQHMSCTLFQEAISLKSTKAMFFGHYHNNDAWITTSGIDLVFGQHSGFSHKYRIDFEQNRHGGYDYDMRDIFQYGNERGGTLIAIASNNSQRGYTISPFLAKDNVKWDDLSIDYENLYQSLLLEENSTVTR